MEKSKKLKIIVGLFYIIFVSSFLLWFFSKFSLEDLTSYDFIRENRSYLLKLREDNLILVSLLFLLGVIFWVFAAGFGSPVGLMAGFIFGQWLGMFLITIGCSVGATFLYIFGNYFLKDVIKKNFLDKFKNLELKFKNSEFTFLLIYRMVGGIPFPVQNLLPVLFNVKINNYFISTLFGLMPQLFLMVSLGSGFEKVINNNETAPSIKDIIFTQEIYIPIIAFIILIFITLIGRRLFYKK